MWKSILGVLAVATIARSIEPSTLISAERGNAKVGENCERDINCIENAFCRYQRTCFCDTSYAPSADKSVCQATSGLTCTENSDCRTMANATCRQGACACREGFNLDIRNTSNCVPMPSRIGDRCQRNDDCEEAFDRSMCINESCRCITGHHFVNATAKCIQTKGIYQSCAYDYQCRLDDDTPDALECRNKECVCKEGDSRCSKGSLRLIATTIVALSILLPRVI